MKIILGSASSRRKELMDLAGFDFESIESQVDEGKIIKGIIREDFPSTDVYVKTLCQSLALAKAEDVFLSLNKKQDYLVIGADTIVVYDGKVLGKPRDKEEAKKTLNSLSGNVHSVFTSVALLTLNSKRVFTELTRVRFFDLNQDQEKIIKDYVESGSPMDKAGGYGIQDMGGLLVKEIEGDYFNVVGLPIARLYREINSFC